jgi:small subunit ribosomal protein S1
MDRKRGNIVVSRRSVLEEGRAEAKKEMASTLEEGQVMEGTVKNITDYGAFIDLGEMDGLLHVTDISWKRISHPSEVLSVGKKVKVKLIKYNSDSQRLSLGMKQLNEDPWKGADDKFKVGNKYEGVVTNIADYGAFVEIDKGIEGLVHVSEMSWNKKNTNPFKLVAAGDKVEVVILDFDMQKRRLSMGMKQAINNLLDIDKIHEGEITNITEFGIFVKINEDIDGLIHINDLSWNGRVEEELKKYNKGMMIKSKVLEIDAEKERIALGIKQLDKDPFEAIISEKFKKGSIVTCLIGNVVDAGLEVKLENDISGFIKKSDLSREKEEQKPSRFAKGEKVDAMLTNIDKTTRRVSLSIKAMELEEEKKAMKDYGSTDSGASLGDILGAALEAKSEKKDKKVINTKKD